MTLGPYNWDAPEEQPNTEGGSDYDLIHAAGCFCDLCDRFLTIVFRNNFTVEELGEIHRLEQIMAGL